MKISNPFEIIAKINQYHNRTVIVLLVLSILILAPFAYQGFTNTKSDFSGFLPDDLESSELGRLVNQEFPGGADASMVVILQSSEESTLSAYDNQFRALISNITAAVTTNDKLVGQVEAQSWVSLEESAKKAYNDALTQTDCMLEELLTPLFSDIAGNMSFMKELVENVSTLASSAEQLSLFPDMYLTTFYDFSRSVFYLANLTSAYDTYLSESHINALYPYWNNQTGEINSGLVMQGYLATYDNYDPRLTPAATMDLVLNSLTFTTLNNSLDDIVPPSTVPTVQKLLLKLNQSWTNTLVAEINAGGSFFGSFEGLPSSSPTILSSQGAVLGRLAETSQEAFVPFFTSVSEDEQLVQEFEQIEELLDPTTIEQNETDVSPLLALPEAFTKLYFDVSRSIFYLANLTDAYSWYFGAEDYAPLYPYWFNETGELDQLVALQSYLATFEEVDVYNTPAMVMDQVVSSVVLELFNQSLQASVPAEAGPMVSSLLQLLNTTWHEAYNTDLGLYGSLYNTLEGTPNPSMVVLGSQQLLLGRLFNISQDTLVGFVEELMANEALVDSLSGLGESLAGLGQGTTVDSNDLADLHSTPQQYAGAWFDIARSIYYLANHTDAYQTQFNQTTDIYLVNQTWANTSFGLWNLDPTLLFTAYDMTNETVPPSVQALGLDMYTVPSIADNIINSLVFQLFNGSAFASWAAENPTNLTGYLVTPEYQNLLLLNATWVAVWQGLYQMNGAFFNGFVGTTPFCELCPEPFNQTNNPGNMIELSQLGVFNELNEVTNTTFKNYLTAVFSAMASQQSHSQILAQSPVAPTSPQVVNSGPTIPDNSTLEQITLALVSSMMTNLTNGFPINQTTFSQLLQGQVIPVAVEYRNQTIPDVVMRSTVLGLMGQLLSDFDEEITSEFDLSSMEGGGLIDPNQINTTKLVEALNVTDTLGKVYDTTVVNATTTVAEVSSEKASVLCTEIKGMIPEPTVFDFPRSILNSLVSEDNRTTLLILSFYHESYSELLDNVELVREDINEVFSTLGLEEEVHHWVSGEIASTYDDSHSINEDIEIIDRVAVVLVLLLLSIVFLSIVAPIVPLAGIGIAIVSAVGFIWIISEFIGQSIPSLMLAILSVTMLGAGVDYCLFIMWRYKEERQHGRNRYLAVREAVVHAGESVASSGSTVMIGFGSLLLSSFVLLNQLGLGPMIGIGFSLVAALTLIPIGLYIFGDRLFYPRNFEKDYEKKRAEIQETIRLEKENLNNNSNADGNNNGNGGNHKRSTKTNTNKVAKHSILKRMSHWTVRHPWPVIFAFLLVTIFFTYQASRIEVSYDSSDLMPINVESVEGIEAMHGSFPSGQLYPIKLALNFNDPLANSTDRFYSSAKLDQIEMFVIDIHEEFGTTEDGRVLVKQINTVTRPNGVPVNYTGSLDQITISQMQQFVGSNSNTTVIINLLVDVDPIGPEALNLVGNLWEWRDQYYIDHANDGFGKDDVEILVGGTPASFKEMSDIINRETPFIIVVVLVGIFIILFLITGSLFTPVRLELTIIMTVIISLGSVQLFFVDFLGRGIPWVMPVMLFVIIFGLGMDYDIFIVTRMREEVALRGMTDEDAIIEALDKTGTIITAAGVIMAFSLGSLFVGDSNILKIFGFSFFIAILLDATLVRQLLVPAIMVVAQRANWWNPIKSLQRVPSEEERIKIREQQLQSLEEEHLYDDMDDTELRSLEKELKGFIKELKNLDKEGKTDLTQERPAQILQRIGELTPNAKRTFGHYIAKIEQQAQHHT